jgi:DNA-binding response OmpR family regulator
MAISGQYDVIILDTMFPKRNGIEVLRSIRSSGSATPVQKESSKIRSMDLIKAQMIVS